MLNKFDLYQFLFLVSLVEWYLEIQPVYLKWGMKMAAGRYNKELKKNIKMLKQYVPIVDRVHGNHHPEFHDVRRVFEEMMRKMDDAGSIKPELDSEFMQLREITGNYTVPEGVCETYEAVYRMLSGLDEAYYDS